MSAPSAELSGKGSARAEAIEAGCGAGVEDRLDVDAVVPVEIRQVARLAEMLDAERPHLVAAHRAQPAQGRGMAIDDSDQVRVGGQRRQQLLDLRAGAAMAGFAGSLRRMPAGVEP